MTNSAINFLYYFNMYKELQIWYWYTVKLLIQQTFLKFYYKQSH